MTTEELIAARIRQLARHLHVLHGVVKKSGALQRRLQLTDSTNPHVLRRALEKTPPQGGARDPSALCSPRQRREPPLCPWLTSAYTFKNVFSLIPPERLSMFL